MSLKDDEVKLKLIELVSKGDVTVSQAAKGLGIPQNTASDFLLRKTWKEWWGVYDNRDADGPEIVYIDIETSPIVSAHWRLFKENIGLEQILIDWQIICFTAKFEKDERTIDSDSREDYPVQLWVDNPVKDQIKMLEVLWEVLDRADVVIGHNVKRFDLGKINDKFIQFGFPRPSPYKIVDTLRMTKGIANATSNKLQYWTTHLGQAGKLQHNGMPLWVGCLKGDQESWDLMVDYCRQDVLELDPFYKTIRGWDDYHPNMALYYNDSIERCNTCGGSEFEELDKKAYTNLSSFETLRCKGCGSIKRRRKNLRSKDQMANTLMNVRQ